MLLDVFLRRAVSRLRVRDVLRTVAGASLAAALLLVVLRAAGVSDTLAGFIAVIVLIAGALSAFVLTRRLRTPQVAAATIERADPSLRNLLVTAEQLLTRPEMTRAPMRNRVFAEAARRVATMDLQRSIPVRRDAALAVLGLAVFALAPGATRPARAANPPISRSPGASGSRLADAGFTVSLEPPAYSGRAARTLTDPSSIDVLAGTRGTFHLANTASVRLRLNGVEAQGPSVTFTESGFVAVDGRIVPVTVVPDRAPDVRVTAPAKDLRVPNTAASIPIAVEATDDLALQTLELRYTVVSGGGEQFSFTEGTLPASVVRTSERTWRLAALLSLAQLKLEPGDAVIYRAVAADKRPGEAGTASSDTFFVEVAGPGDVPLEGVEMPPDKERYALSQAMIVLKIERLQAREKAMARDALAEAAANIAAEQRAVRANFIFLLGGEIEDEEVEAAHEHEITEGRLANQARREITAATVLMGAVEKGLAAVSTRTALPPAREAVKALQRAFGHSRYLLRALPSRVRLDPARRGTGDVSSAADWSRALAPPAPDPVAAAARAALGELALASNEIAGPSSGRAPVLARLDVVTERLLATGNADLQLAARDVLAARTELSRGRVDEARAGLKKAAGPLVKHAQRGRIDGASTARDAARLAGAAAIAGGGRR